VRPEHRDQLDRHYLIEEPLPGLGLEGDELGGAIHLGPRKLLSNMDRSL
jgi:hypothetical protein